MDTNPQKHYFSSKRVLNPIKCNALRCTIVKSIGIPRFKQQTETEDGWTYRDKRGRPMILAILISFNYLKKTSSLKTFSFLPDFV